MTPTGIAPTATFTPTPIIENPGGLESTILITFGAITIILLGGILLFTL